MVMVRVRRRCGMSLNTLAGLVNLSTAFLSRIETGERELRCKSHVLALAAALRVTPAELIPWVLSENPAGRSRVGLSGLPVVRPGAGSCAAEKTRDLLDCDCGCVTDGMKVQILDMWDAHGPHVRPSGLTNG